jgi:hypothetical protein
MADRTELLQGTLDLIVLKLLRAGPANGWDLTQSIQVVSKGALDVNYGSLYPRSDDSRRKDGSKAAGARPKTTVAPGSMSSRLRDSSSSTASAKRGSASRPRSVSFFAPSSTDAGSPPRSARGFRLSADI